MMFRTRGRFALLKWTVLAAVLILCTVPLLSGAQGAGRGAIRAGERQRGGPPVERRACVHRAQRLLQPKLRGLKLSGKLGCEIAARIDLGDELRVGCRRALGAGARCRGGLLQPCHLRTAFFECLLRFVFDDQRTLPLENYGRHDAVCLEEAADLREVRSFRRATEI